DPEKVYFDNKEHIKEIISNECANCNHDYVGIPNPPEYRRMLFKRVDERLGIKNNIRKLPGFNNFSDRRRKRQYNDLLKYYRGQEKQSLSHKKFGKKVLICGWYGTETLGDKGIIGGVMHALRQQLGDDINFTVVSLYTYISEITKR